MGRAWGRQTVKATRWYICRFCKIGCKGSRKFLVHKRKHLQPNHSLPYHQNGIKRERIDCPSNDEFKIRVKEELLPIRLKLKQKLIAPTLVEVQQGIPENSSDLYALPTPTQAGQTPFHTSQQLESTSQHLIQNKLGSIELIRKPQFSAESPVLRIVLSRCDLVLNEIKKKLKQNFKNINSPGQKPNITEISDKNQPSFEQSATHSVEKRMRDLSPSPDMLQRSLEQNEANHGRNQPEYHQKHQCLSCTKTLGSKHSLKKHMHTQATEKSLKCGLCGQVFRYKTLLENHRRNHANTLIECQRCPRTFSSCFSLKKHMGTHAGERPFKCGECSRSFPLRCHLTRHACTRSGEYPFKCGKCSRSLARRFSLIHHAPTHTEEKPFKCTKCGKYFSQKSHLIRHIRSHNGEKPFKCGKCSKSFSQRFNLIRHIRSHTAEKPFKCGKCSKSYAQRSSFIRHTRTHTWEKPFKCGKSSKSFSRRSDLIGHTHAHTGEKPFNCINCSKSFAHKSSLILHARTHSGEKRFKGGKCSKSFSRRSYLIVHTRTHTGEKPFKCGHCSKSFAHRSSLIGHTRTHTGEKPFKCGKCSKSFASRTSLISHTRTNRG